VSAEIARPFAELRWTGVFAGNVPGDAEVEEPADLSHTSGEERESRGEALTAVYLSHRVSAGPITARTRFRARELGEGFDSYVDIHHHQASRQCGRVLSPRQRRRPCGTASPSAIAAATRRSNQHGERLDEEDRQEGSSKEVQC
jgi:hypothetical protein